MSKGNNKDTRTNVIDVVLVWFMLNLNIFHAFFQCLYFQVFSSTYIFQCLYCILSNVYLFLVFFQYLDFEQLNVCWESKIFFSYLAALRHMILITAQFLIRIESHREPRNEIGFDNLAKHISWTFQKYQQVGRQVYSSSYTYIYI